MSGKVYLHYRHEDGRLIEISGSGSKAEVWLVYPHRELLKNADSIDEGKKELPEGFELDETAVAPPCPKCNQPSRMAYETGMYTCEDCDAEF